MAQISLAKSSCKFALNGLKNWMKPEKVSTIGKSSVYSSIPASPASRYAAGTVPLNDLVVRLSFANSWPGTCGHNYVPVLCANRA